MSDLESILEKQANSLASLKDELNNTSMEKNEYKSKFEKISFEYENLIQQHNQVKSKNLFLIKKKSIIFFNSFANQNKNFKIFNLFLLLNLNIGFRPCGIKIISINP